jgi:hypothetical protein
MRGEGKGNEVYQRQPELCVDHQMNYQKPHFVDKTALTLSNFSI